MCTKKPHTIIPEKKAPCSVLVANNYFLDLLDYPSVLSKSAIALLKEVQANKNTRQIDLVNASELKEN